jgi:hypothetical protein
VRNSPADAVPSHGTWLWGTAYAIDLVPVDDADASAPPTWRAVLATERPETFAGFGRPVLAPVDGVVVLAHDGEDDHAARRSPLARLAYALGQRARVETGAASIAGNHLVIRTEERDAFVLLAHLRRGSIRPRVGARVGRGEPVAECGNSGNSTEPHVHLQVTADPPAPDARALPLAFGDTRSSRVPRTGEIVAVDQRPGDARRTS